jgi:hypothetical protein
MRFQRRQLPMSRTFTGIKRKRAVNLTAEYFSVVVPTAISFVLTLAAFFLAFLTAICLRPPRRSTTLDESRLEEQLILRELSEKNYGGKESLIVTNIQKESVIQSFGSMLK